jgi:transcription antitermination factor NusG
MKFENLKKNWYVAYTTPQSERKAKARLDEMEVRSFLPMQTVVRQWSDRKKKLEVPVFPNYLFIYTNSFERFEIIKMPELVYYVSFEGKAVTVSEEIITSLEKILTSDVEVTNENFVRTGSKIKITDGRFAGAEGILLRKNGKTRLVVSIEVLKRSISVDISAACVESVC